MQMRFALGILCLSLFCLAGCGGGGGGGNDNGGGGGGGGAAPVIGSVSVSPRLLDATGGDVTITASVADADGDPLIVIAIVDSRAGFNDAVSVTLASTGGSTYTGTFTAPSNTTDTEVVYDVTITANDGVTTSSSAAGTITVQGLQAPPPPPNP